MNVKSKVKSKRYLSSFRIFWVLFTAFLVTMGVQMIQKTLANPEPLEISYEDYLETRPQNTWVRLTGCRLNLLQAAYNTKLTKAFIPVYVAVDTGKSKARLVMKTTDDRYMNVIKGILEYDKKKDKNGKIKFLLKNMKPIHDLLTIEGLILTGLDVDRSEKNKLTEEMENLAKDFLVIEQNKGPRPLAIGILFFALALASAAGFVINSLNYFRKKQQTG